MWRWMDMRARPVSLSWPVVVWRYVFNTFNFENVLSVVAFETGSVPNIRRSVITVGRNFSCASFTQCDNCKSCFFILEMSFIQDCTCPFTIVIGCRRSSWYNVAALIIRSADVSKETKLTAILAIATERDTGIQNGCQPGWWGYPGMEGISSTYSTPPRLLLGYYFCESVVQQGGKLLLLFQLLQQATEFLQRSHEIIAPSSHTFV